MKGYVVTILQLPESVASANRCVESGVKFGIDIEIFPAIYKTDIDSELFKTKLMVGKFDESFSHKNAVIGNFLSQFYIWNKIYNSNEPGIVLEHDAIIVANVPDLQNGGDIINLGKPSYGKFKEQKLEGIYPIFSKSYVDKIGIYLPGAHGYYLTPNGALRLIDKAKKIGVYPCDLFINTVNFPDLMEVSPWPIEAHDSFTSIQRKKGCLGKHNFSQNFRFL